jgi:hypothetical protein
MLADSWCLIPQVYSKGVRRRHFLSLANGARQNLVAEDNFLSRSDGQPYLLPITSPPADAAKSIQEFGFSPLIRVGGVTNMI